jgi:hypothetical protein
MRGCFHKFTAENPPHPTLSPQAVRKRGEGVHLHCRDIST